MDEQSVEVAVRRLEPGQAQLLQLATRPGMTYRLVAESLGITPGEVCRDLRLALSALRAWA